MAKTVVLHLGRKTENDAQFYSRWQAFGEVSSTIPEDRSSIIILVVDQRVEVTNEFLSMFPNIKYLCSATTGHTHLKFSSDRTKLVTLRGETDFLQDVRSVSEFTMKLMLELSRPNSSSPGRVLNGKTLGIVGFGRIGKQVAELARSFRMTVLAYDRHNQKEDLTALFESSDYVTIHLEENDITKGMISEELLLKAKQGCYVINTARPSIVNERDMIQALKSGRVAGYAQDFPLSRPNLENLNILCTSHIAGNTLEDRIRTDEFIVEKLKRLIAQGLDPITE